MSIVFCILLSFYAVSVIYIADAQCSGALTGVTPILASLFIVIMIGALAVIFGKVYSDKENLEDKNRSLKKELIAQTQKVVWYEYQRLDRNTNDEDSL